MLKFTESSMVGKPLVKKLGLLQEVSVEGRKIKVYKHLPESSIAENKQLAEEDKQPTPKTDVDNMKLF